MQFFTAAGVLAQRAARRNSAVAGRQVGEVEGAGIDLTFCNRTRIIAYQAAHAGSRAVQCSCAFYAAKSGIRYLCARLVAGRNAADSIRCAMDVRIINIRCVDRAVVMGSNTAGFTVGSKNTAVYLVILQYAVRFVTAGDAAGKTAASVQNTVAGGAVLAEGNFAFVAACNAACILVDYLDRPRIVGDILDQAFIAACYTAAVVAGGYRRRSFNRHGIRAACIRVNANRTRCRIQARHTAGLGGAADFYRHALGGDGAQVIACHAAGGGDAVDVAIGTFQRNNAGFAIVTGHTADVQPAADAAAFRRG